jgi:hypothetical protein
VIPARPGYVVSFKTRVHGTDKYVWNEKPVVAWGDDGDPLVVGRRGLELASRLLGGDIETWELEENEYTHTIPGGGWMVTVDDGLGVMTFPVVAWQIDRDGYGRALTAGGDGELTREDSKDCAYWHPSCDPTWRPDWKGPRPEDTDETG